MTTTYDEDEIHERLRELLDYVGVEVAAMDGAPGCNRVAGCDRPGRYWHVFNYHGDRIYDEEAFVHADTNERHQWRHVSE